MKYTLEIKDDMGDRAIIGTGCLICGSFIPIYWLGSDDRIQICEECRRRLKDLLYPSEREL